MLYGTSVLVGIFIGVVGMCFAMDQIPTSYKNIVDHAIQECQKSLPRDRYCTIVAVPVDTE
jgi:hypothetical protein